MIFSGTVQNIKSCEILHKLLELFELSYNYLFIFSIHN